MSAIVDLFHATIPAGDAERLLRVRGPAIAQLRERCPGLRRAELVRVDATTWVDVLVWDSPGDAAAAADQLAAIPALREMHALAGTPTAHVRGSLEHAA